MKNVKSKKIQVQEIFLSQKIEKLDSLSTTERSSVSESQEHQWFSEKSQSCVIGLKYRVRVHLTKIVDERVGLG